MTNLIFHNVPVYGGDIPCVDQGAPQVWEDWARNAGMNNTQHASIVDIETNTLRVGWARGKIGDSTTELLTTYAYDWDTGDALEGYPHAWDELTNTIQQGSWHCGNDVEIIVTYESQEGSGGTWIRMHRGRDDLWNPATKTDLDLINKYDHTAIGGNAQYDTPCKGLKDYEYWSNQSFRANDDSCYISLSSGDYIGRSPSEYSRIPSILRYTIGEEIIFDPEDGSFSCLKCSELYDLPDVTDYDETLRLWYDLSENVFFVFNTANGTKALEKRLFKLDYNLNILNTWSEDVLPDRTGENVNLFNRAQFVRSKGDVAYWMFPNSNMTQIRLYSFDPNTNNSTWNFVGGLSGQESTPDNELKAIYPITENIGMTFRKQYTACIFTWD